MLAYLNVPTPFGPLTLVASPAGLTEARFPEDKYWDAERCAAWCDAEEHEAMVVEAATLTHLQRAREQVQAWCDGQRQTFDLVLAPAGTAFQSEVWRALSRIPYGQTSTYGALAASIGRANAARAVGAATGRNPLSIIVPCHRLVGHHGALTGFASGLARKSALLEFELRLAGV